MFLPVFVSTTEWWMCMALPGLALDGLGHEGGKAVVAQRRLADQALEEEDLVGQPHRIAMGEVDLDLAGAAFLQDAVDLEAPAPRRSRRCRR